MNKKLNRNFVAKDILDEKIILDLRTGDYHSLNASAAVLWDALSKGQDHAAIVKTLTETFEVNLTTAEADMSAALESFAQNGFLE